MPEISNLFDVSEGPPAESSDHLAAALRGTEDNLDGNGSSVSLSPETAPLEQSPNHTASGKFALGNRAGALPANCKPKKAVKIRHLFNDDMDRIPTEASLARVSSETGIPIEEFEGLTRGQVTARVMSERAMLGHVEPFREVHDRLDPKTTKAEVEHSVARPMPPVGDNAVENQAAADFFEDL